MKRTGTLAKANPTEMLVGLLVVLSLLVGSTTAFAGAPAKNGYSTPLTDAGTVLQPDGSQQTIGTTLITLTSGGLPVTTYTVTILGTSTVAAGEVTGVYVTDGTNTWSATGSYGPGSVVACTGPSATPVDAANLTIRLTLAAASAGKTVGVELTTENGGNQTGLPAAGTLHNIFAAADTLSVALNTPVASSGSPSQTNLEMQVLQVDSDNAGNGSVEITTVTVNDLGTATTGDIDFLKVHLDSDNNFGNGVLDTVSTATWAGTSTVVDITAMAAATRTVTFGTSKYVWITYDLSATIVDGTTLQSSVTGIAVAGGDSGASGAWNSNNFATSSGPSNTLADCAGCHEYPPVDAASRDAGTGNFVGDHDKHAVYTCATCHVAPATETSIDFAHRSGTLNMDSGNIGVGTDNGTYSKGTGFAQSNSPTTGTCSLVDCHSNAVTPQWGVGTTSCSTCHTLPPSAGAHDAHYAAKGWAADETNCTVCHPDNTAGHSDVTDSSVIVNAGLTYAGGGGSCSAPGGLGCHNDYATPNWSGGTAVCTTCHTAGGVNAADPGTGLHAPTNLLGHDDAFDTNKTCTSCHTSSSPSSLHFDGTVQNGGTATFNYNTTFIPAGYDRAGDNCAATCHTDGGTWNREWSGATDAVWAYANDAATTAVCGNCHGSFFTGWNIVGATSHDNPDIDNDNNPGTADNPDTLATSKGSHSECSKCHGWGHANYSGGLKHKNNTLEMNSTLDTTPGDGDCTTNCHAGQTLTMVAASGWTDASVAGDGVACGDCHTGGVTPVSASGAHVAHGATSASVAADPASIALCIECHGHDGTGANHNDGTLSWATNLTYSAARGVLSGTCSGTAGCHVASTNIAWNATPTNCNQCHYSTTDIDNWGWTGSAGNISMIDSTQYTSVGHGQATINGAAANKDCMACHEIAIVHDKTATLTGSNPFRLKAGFTCNDNNAGCHTITGLLGTHDQATAGANYTWPFAAKCVDCHDPHGDGSNLSMIHSDLADNGSAANWVRNAPDAAIETMVFTSTTGIAADSYAEGAATYDGICQECHTQTTSMKDNTITNGANHTATNGCMSCHAHGDGFKAAGCNGCHGGDNATIGNKNFWPGGSGTVYPDRPGEHNIHIQKLAAKLGYPFNDTLTDVQQKAMCDYCHNDAAGAGGGGHGDYASPANVGSFNRLWDGAADGGTAGSYTAGDGTNGVCSNVDCHNNNPTATTPTSYDWYDGAASACVMCHAPGGTGTVDPLSGLHKPGTLTSSMPHDDSFATGGTCTTCHSTMSAVGSGTHGDGANNGNATASLGLVAGLYTQTSTVGNGSGTCSGGTAGAAGCHGIDPVDAGTWARKWDDTISYQTNGTECAGCHGGFSGDWTFGSADNATDFDVSHAKDWDAAQSTSDGAEIIGNHSNNTSNADRCNICHVYGDAEYAWGTYHRDRKITMNSTMGYSGATFNCSTNCHSEPWGNTDHNLEAASSSGWATRGNTVAGPALACTGCHGGGSPSAGVSSASSHVMVGRAGGYNTFVDCTECHSGHADGSTGANDVEINTAGASFANKYSSHAGGAIQLGGGKTTGSTEAEICWNCHQNDTYQGAPDISEWDGSSATYDYGSVTANDLNWLTTNWSSARPEFAYKNGKLSNKPTVASPATGTANGGSTHGVMGGAAGVDTLGNIGCAACHDVHNGFNGAGTNPATDKGKPYVRGTWQSNPYLEDGAPRSGAGQTINSGYFGAVPRGDQNTNYGGYQIDQNNGSPALTADSAAGLCELCHGDGGADGSWTTAELGAIGGSTAWVSTGNSHAYVVKGGLISGGYNLYNESIRLPISGFVKTTTDGGRAGRPGMAYRHHTDLSGTSEDGYGFRGTDGRSFVDAPGITGASRPYGHTQYGWGATVDVNTVDGGFHQFTCSKCHNPHASRLPRLMITNCLDTKINTWDDTLTVPAQGASNGQGTDTVSQENGGVGYSNATSAQNCHRLKDPSFTNAGGNGWNTTTPWQ